MAIIIQEMIDPFYSGVCYSTINPDNPRTIIEFTYGLSDELMSGNQQGTIASFDQNLRLTVEHECAALDLERVAQIAKNLENVFDQTLDLEFIVSENRELYLVQIRPITDPEWQNLEIPEIDTSRVLLDAEITRGAGSFTGPVFVFRSPTEMRKYAKTQNKQALIEVEKQWDKLEKFNRENTDGYCLVLDNLEACETLMRNLRLSNLKALITVNYASRFSHPIKVISETGAFYLGVLGRKDLLDSIETEDTLTVISNQSKGLVFDLTKPIVEQKKIELEGMPVVEYQTAMTMIRPHYKEVDNKLFIDEADCVGVCFWDYNEEKGIPTDVFYNLVDKDGNIIVTENKYISGQAMYTFTDCPSLLRDLQPQAKQKIQKDRT